MRSALIVLILMVAAAATASPANALAPFGGNVTGLWLGNGDATDAVGGHNGALLGGAAFAPAVSGQAFSFAGDQQAVDIPDSPDLYPGTGSFTIAGWVHTSQATGDQTLIAHYECGLSCPTDLANSYYWLGVSSGVPDGFVRDSDASGPIPAPDNGGQNVASATSIADGTDHQLALVRDVGAARLRLYVDGSLVADAPLGPGADGSLANLDNEADDVYIGAQRRCGSGASGCDGSLVAQMNGLVDDVVYWSRAVTGPELAAIHAAGPNGLTTDVTAPTSSAAAPASTTSTAVPVTYTASDPQGPAPRVHDPAGIVQVDLYAKAPGQAAFAKVASVAGGAASGTFAYTASAGLGTYAFETVATDAAGNAEALPAAPDATTVLTAPAAPSKTAAPTRIEQVVTGLPSTKACLSRRSFTIRLRIPSGVTVTSATVLVNGRSVAVRRGARLRAPVNLIGLPKGRFTVKIAVRLGGGKTISGTRSYRTCAAKRKGGATPHV